MHKSNHVNYQFNLSVALPPLQNKAKLLNIIYSLSTFWALHAFTFPVSLLWLDSEFMHLVIQNYFSLATMLLYI